MSTITDVHADSTRVGIRLGIAYVTGNLPAEPTVEALLASLPGSHNISVHQVPMTAILRPSAPRALPTSGQDELRRSYVMKSWEGLIHHAGDTSLMTKDQIDNLVELSWHAARKHMEMEDVAAQLGTISTPKVSP